MKSLLESSSKIDIKLDGFRAHTQAEREEALILMESDLKNSLETQWRETLAVVKADGMRRIAAEEEAAKQECANVAKSISNQLHEEYSKKLTELDAERKKRQRHTTVLLAQIKSLSKATEEATADLEQRRLSLNTRRTRALEQKEARAAEYAKLRQHLKELWEARRVPLSQRVAFLIHADNASEYSAKVLGMYEAQILELERTGPLRAVIKKRDELIVRMEAVRRYCRNPELAIRDGTAALLNRVGFTLPTPTPMHEAELMAAAESRQFARREKIRREAACHKLNQQWALCQQELIMTTEQLHRLLDEYASSGNGQRFSQFGPDGEVPYVPPHVPQDVTSEPLALHKFSTFQVTTPRDGLGQH